MNIKSTDNESVTALPRGRVESNASRIQSTATKVNTIRRARWTSLRGNGEVEPHVAAWQSSWETTRSYRGGVVVIVGVAGGSRLERGRAREDGRSTGIGSGPSAPVVGAGGARPAEVRAPVVAKKRGNARGAKGGRKAEKGVRAWATNIPHRLLIRARTQETKVCPSDGQLSVEAIGNHRRTGVKPRLPLSCHSILKIEANC